MTRKKTKNEETSRQPQSVAEAEHILQSLLSKQTELQAAAEQLSASRQAAAFRAHVGDGDHQLVSIMRSIRESDADLTTLSEAIHEARNRVAVAQGFERAAREEANATKVLEICTALEAAGEQLGDAAKMFADASRQVSTLLHELHGLGITSPTGEQFRVFGSAATRTMLATSIWSREFPPIGPLERRTFDGIVGGWVQNIRARVSGRLGAKDEAA